MRPTRTRLVAGAAVLACLAGPAAALAGRPEDRQPPARERSGQDGDARGRDRDRHDSGGTPAPPEQLVPVPPEIETPEPEPSPEPRERRRPRAREDGARPAQPPRAPEAEAAAPEPEPAEPQPESVPRQDPSSAKPRDARDDCEGDLRRGEALVGIDDLCRGRTGDDRRDVDRTSVSSAGGTVSGFVLLGALALLGAVGLRMLALRPRRPR
jgi:outer membrane biosynthesis protein TonB